MDTVLMYTPLEALAQLSLAACIPYEKGCWRILMATWHYTP